MNGLTNMLNIGGEGFFNFASLNNFVKYELLDNGNYSLVFTCEENGELSESEKEDYGITSSNAKYTRHMYFKIEITTDAKVLNIEYKGVAQLHFGCEKEQELLERLGGAVIEYSAAYTYGTVDTELMETLYEVINASPEIDR